MDTAYDTDSTAHFVPPNASLGHDKHALLRYALATASIYRVCCYGPFGPTSKFAGANLMPGPLCAILSTKEGDHEKR